MKFLQILLSISLAGLGFAQEFGTWQTSPPPDWDGFRANLAAPPVDLSAPGSIASGPAPMSGGFGIMSVGNDADTITPEIQSLAENLRNDVLTIYRYVAHNIAFEAYYGSKRGAHLTLLEKRGNAHDQSSLLVALLRAAGHEANYIIGPGYFHYDTLKNMLGFPDYPLPEYNDTQIVNNFYNGTLPAGMTVLQARRLSNTFNFLSPRGYPIISYTTDGNHHVFDHVWVEVIVGTNNYLLNPSVKTTYGALPIDVLARSGYSGTSSFLSTAGGTPGTGSIGNASVTSIDEGAIHSQLTSMTTTFSNWMKANHPNIAADAVIGKRSILPRDIPSFSHLLPVNIISTQWDVPTRYAAIPPAQMSRFDLRMGFYNYSTSSYTAVYHTEPITMPSLRGRKLSLTFSGNNAIFQLDESTLRTQAIPSGRDRLDMDISAIHDHYKWQWNGSAYVKIEIGRNNGTSNTQQYLKNDAYAYVIPYGFKPNGELLRRRQAILDKYLRDGKTNASPEVRTEVLNVMGLTWLHETSLADDLVVAHEDIDLAYHHRIGRVAQEESFYIDFILQYYAGVSRATRTNIFATLPTSQIIGSAYEHAVIEHMQNAGEDGAASTVKLLHVANQAGTTIYRVNSGNWKNGPKIRDLVTGYSASDLANIDATVSAPGGDVLLPASGDIILGDWEGAGFILRKTGYVTMGISGGFSGGYNSVTGQVQFVPIISHGRSDPSYWENGSFTQNVGYTPTALGRYYGADPVDLATGSFVMEKEEMTLGGAMPRGLQFSRYFNSSRRYDTSPGLGGGWTHSLYGRAYERASTKGSLGLTTARHVVPSLVAAAVIRDLVNNDSGTAKNTAVAALVAQWATEQLNNNAVGVVLGDKTLEFVRMPDGSYEPPPGSTLSLAKNGSDQIELSERHGSTFTFGTDGWIESITDLHGNSVTFGYDGGKLATVADTRGRSFTFTWSGNQITKVADSTTRDVEFDYSPAGDLTTVTDVEDKEWDYTYTADHQIESVIDPESRIITSNTYDSQGRVAEQKSMGQANKLWKLYYTGDTTVEEDPEGNSRLFYFDGRGRGYGSMNQLGYYETRILDGEDHITMTLNEELETTFAEYDVNHNLVSSTDGEDHTTEYFYDTQHRLETLRDKRGKETDFTYTAKHQIESVTDPEGNETSYTYHADGLTHVVTDGEDKTTTTTYDEWGNVEEIKSHDNTVRSFTNNARGDVLTSTDAEERTTVHTWNKRRQPLTTTLPAVVGEPPATTSRTYDNSGNLESITDARGNVTTFTYNSLAKPLTTTMPALPAGNNVITTAYDLRDWAESVTNSLDHSSITEFDEAGRATAVIDPLDRRTESLFDGTGRITEIKDPLARITKFVWNERGEKTRTTNPLTHHVDGEFDENGNQTVVRNRRGEEFITTFDDANRAVTSTTPTGKTTTMTYYGNNLVKTIEEPSTDKTTFHYNGKNLLASKTDDRTITYGYDDSGLLTTVTEGGEVLTREHDARGRLEKFITADADEIGYRHDPHGNLTRLIYPDGKEVNYTYNARNQMASVTDWADRTTTYTYDRLGRLTGITRSYNGTSAVLSYDDAGQLIEQRESTGGKMISLLRFTHDDAGQIQRRFRAPVVVGGAPHPSFTATYDDDNRLATVNGQGVTHDPDGNMTSGPITPESGMVSLTFNVRNQLTHAGGLSYTYDAEGRRRTTVDSSGTIRDVIDPNGAMSRLLVRHHPGGTKTFYVYGLGLLYEVDEAGATKTHHFDQIGSTIVRTDDTGREIGRAEYSAYGMMVRSSGDMDTPFLYNGQLGVQTDRNGLLNMRARYYSPYLMRFLNPDPIGFSGGMNWYAFAEGNPTIGVDPSGLVLETVWDVANLGMGVYSAQDNWRQGNWGWFALDIVGLAYDGTATAVPFLPAGASAGFKASRAAGNTVAHSIGVGHDIAVVVDKTHDAARTVDSSLSATQAGTQVHRQVANQIDGSMWQLDSTYMRGANRASGPQPDLIGNRLWGDVTTSHPSAWPAHVRSYGDMGTGIPILYQRGVGVTNYSRIYSGAGVGLTGLQNGLGLFGVGGNK